MSNQAEESIRAFPEQNGNFIGNPTDYDGCSAKREACMEIVQRAIEGEHRLLVFSQFTSMLERLEQDFINNGGFAEKMSRMRKGNRGF